MTHRWSGWPGAWCLDCGVEDMNEYFLACRECDIGYPGATGKLCSTHEAVKASFPLECPEPGSRRHDPYNSSGLIPKHLVGDRREPE